MRVCFTSVVLGSVIIHRTGIRQREMKASVTLDIGLEFICYSQRCDRGCLAITLAYGSGWSTLDRSTSCGPRGSLDVAVHV
jgi:hypothetical protein